MAETALFTNKPNVIIKNSEGAILIQILLQIMRGSDSCNSFFESLLNRVKHRSTQKPLSNLLKKHILGVYLSALIYNKSATLIYFEQNGMTAQLVQELVDKQKKMKHNYERRMFIVGLSELLQNDVLPESLRP